MRVLMCGVDAEGRSCVIDEREADFTSTGKPGSFVARLFETNESPPPSSPAGKTKFTGGSLAPGPGAVRLYSVDHKPHDLPRNHAGPELHWRDAIDIVFVIEGEGDMMLADGAHPMKAGDCIVMPGSDHAMRPAPVGCRLMVFTIGTPPNA